MFKRFKINIVLLNLLLIFTLLISDSSINFANDEIIDLKDRKKELTKEAHAGDSQSQFMLGRLALETKNPPDHSTAVYWFRIAAESNHLEAQEMLGAHLFSGLGVPPNPIEAANWWHKAAMAGSSKSQASLGVLYALGSGVEKNVIEAYKWLTIAALNGNKAARTQSVFSSDVKSSDINIPPHLRIPKFAHNCYIEQ